MAADLLLLARLIPAAEPGPADRCDMGMGSCRLGGEGTMAVQMV